MNIKAETKNGYTRGKEKINYKAPQTTVFEQYPRGKELRLTVMKPTSRST